MCGMHRTTVSPSSSSTRRSTPCVAGCCGPMLMSMCSPSSSGAVPIAGGSSVVTGPFSVTVVGLRTKRPSASTPAVPSATSTVRVVVAMLFPRPFAAGESAAHVFGEILERLRDRQLFHGVASLGGDPNRLTKMLRSTEAATQREILAQRMPFPIRLPHENASQIGMAGERDAEHVVALALEPIRALVDGPDAVDHEWRALVQRCLEPKEPSMRQRAQMPHDLEWLLGVAELDRRHIGEIVVLLRGIVVQPAHHLGHAVRMDVDVRVSPNHFRPHEDRGEFLCDQCGSGIRFAALLREIARSRGRGGAGIRAAGKNWGERNRHSPDRVCCTELPNGSESSSMRLAGMYRPLSGSGSISFRIALSDIFSRITFACSIM